MIEHGDGGCRHQLHLTMVREAAAKMPALVVHRVRDVECGRKDEELHSAQWSVMFPAKSAIRRVHLCDRHFALFVLDREQFEVMNVPLFGQDGDDDD